MALRDLVQWSSQILWTGYHGFGQGIWLTGYAGISSTVYDGLG